MTKFLIKKLSVHMDKKRSTNSIAEPVTVLSAGVPQVDWRSWRGSLAGTNALLDHIFEHATEVRLQESQR